jgi:hypothetical protein
MTPAEILRAARAHLEREGWKQLYGRGETDPFISPQAGVPGGYLHDISFDGYNSPAITYADVLAALDGAILLAEKV